MNTNNSEDDILEIPNPNKARTRKKHLPTVSDDDDEVEYTRKRRQRYTHLEERKMWWFFASELRAGNMDALKKRQCLWKTYASLYKTDKKMYGLESHFRKYMITKIHRASIEKEDLFMCLRFFKIRLNQKQQRYLSERFNCEIDCEADSTFLKAHFLLDGGNDYSLPTEAEERTFAKANKRDEDTSSGEEEEEDNGLTNQGHHQHHFEKNQDEDEDEYDAIITEEQNREDEGEKNYGEEYGARQCVIVEKNRQDNNADEWGARDCVVIEIDDDNRTEPTVIRMATDQKEEQAEGTIATDANDNGASQADNSMEIQENNPIEEVAVVAMNGGDESKSKNRKSHGNPEANPRPSTSQSERELRSEKQFKAGVKSKFVKGALDVLNNRTTSSLFQDQFLWLPGEKYHKYARGINWLTNMEDNDVPAYRP